MRKLLPTSVTAMPGATTAIASTRRGLRLKVCTPKAYLGWAFVLVIPLALTQGPLSPEARVLALAIAGSVAIDIVLALAIAFAADAARRHTRWTSQLPAAVARSALARRRPAKPFWPSGALLCGAIVGLLLDPSSPAAVPFTAGAIASASKHIVRYRSRHVFNPAAIGLLAGSFLFSERISWWGALPDLPITGSLAMLAAGAIVLDRSRKLPSALAFLAAYYTVFLPVGLVDPAKAAEAFRSPISNAVAFFALFMVSDPPTAPITIPDQIAYGAAAAACAAALELTAHNQTFLITALLAANVLAAATRTTRRRTLPRPQARAIPALTLLPTALIIWLLNGPLAPVGTLASNLPHSLTPASVTAPRAFQAKLGGTYRQRTAAGGQVEVDLPLIVKGQPLSSLNIRLYGEPQAGGVAMTSSQVILGTASNPSLYRGTVATIHGTTISATVQTRAGESLALRAQLQINGSGQVRGTLAAHAAARR